MSLNFYQHILFDYCYQQNPDGTYDFDTITNDLKLRNKNEVIDDILCVLEQIYSNLLSLKGIDKNIQKPVCNIILLDQALTKYSRDIYGGKRLQARIENFNLLPTEQNDNLKKFFDYGLKIESTSPYIHRKIAVLLYWLSVLKPFSIEASQQIIKKLGFAGKFHNEYMSYLLMQAALNVFDLRINLHDKLVDFSEFLYDLHYRSLSRSSLELFLNEYIKSI